MINVLYTRIGTPFKDLVRERMNERNAKLIQNDYIEMDPEVAAAFRASTHISRKYLIFFLFYKSCFL